MHNLQFPFCGKDTNLQCTLMQRRNIDAAFRKKAQGGGCGHRLCFVMELVVPLCCPQCLPECPRHPLQPEYHPHR